MSTQNLKFIHLSTGSASAHKADTGAIIFEKESGRIAVANGSDKVEYYGGGRIADATFKNSILTISFNNGDPAITLDFSDTASASGVDKILGKLRYDVDALNVTINGTDKDGSHTPGLVDKVATNKSLIDANKAEIDAINNSSTGILATAKGYTNSKIGDIAEGTTVKKYVDDAKADAKKYADDTFDTKGSAAAAQTAAIEAAKNYTDGEIEKVNTTTSGLRTDVDALKETVGDAGKGLVKGVADLQALHADRTDGTGKMTVAEEVTAGVNAKVGTIAEGTTVKKYVDDGDAKALADAKSYTDGEVKTIKGTTDGLDSRIGALETTVNDASNGLVKKVADNTSKLTTLIGADADKSVRTIANEELAAQLIPGNAAESLDTLQEIAQWIQDHPGDAAAMNTAIENLQTSVGTAGAAADANGSVYARIAKNAADIAGNLTKINANTNSISDHTTRIVALEGKHAEGKTVAEEVAKGIDDLGVTSKSNVVGSDVVVTVTTTKGKVSEVAVDASVLDGKVTAEKTRAEKVEGGLKTSLDGIRSDLGTKAEGERDAFTRIKALETAQSSGSLMWSVWD